MLGIFQNNCDGQTLSDISGKLLSLNAGLWFDEILMLPHFLKNAVNLKKFEIYTDRSAISKNNFKILIDSLSPTIEDITFNWLTDEYFLKIGKQLINLKSVKIKEFQITKHQFFDPNSPNKCMKPAEIFGYFNECNNLEKLNLKFWNVPPITFNTSLNLVLEKLKTLCLCQFEITPKDFTPISELMPNLTKLKLDKYKVKCECQNESESENTECFECCSNFTELIPKISKLRILHLHTYKEYVVQINAFAKKLSELIKEGNLKKIQKISLQHSVQSNQLLQDFRFLAETNPKKIYILQLVFPKANNESAECNHVKEDFGDFHSFDQNPRNFRIILKNVEA